MLPGPGLNIMATVRVEQPLDLSMGVNEVYTTVCTSSLVGSGESLRVEELRH